MPLPRKHLFDGEEIVLERHPDPLVLLPPIGVAIAALVLAGVLSLGFKLKGNVNSVLGLFIPLGILVLALIWLLARWTRWRTTSFTITTDRLVLRSGVFGKKGKEIPLERIMDIATNQTFIERIARTGDLTIESGGEQGQQRIPNVRNPVEIQNAIYKQVERMQARDMDRMAGRRELSLPEQIEKLDELRAKGVLTQAEFDAKKTQLLGLGS